MTSEQQGAIYDLESVYDNVIPVVTARVKTICADHGIPDSNVTIVAAPAQASARSVWPSANWIITQPPLVDAPQLIRRAITEIVRGCPGRSQFILSYLKQSLAVAQEFSGQPITLVPRHLKMLEAPNFGIASWRAAGH